MSPAQIVKLFRSDGLELTMDRQGIFRGTPAHRITHVHRAMVIEHRESLRAFFTAAHRTAASLTKGMAPTKRTRRRKTA